LENCAQHISLLNLSVCARGTKYCDGFLSLDNKFIKNNPHEYPTYTLYFQKLKSTAYIFATDIWVYLRSNFCVLLRKMLTHLFCNTVRIGYSSHPCRWFRYQYQSKARMQLPISQS